MLKLNPFSKKEVQPKTIEMDGKTYVQTGKHKKTKIFEEQVTSSELSTEQKRSLDEKMKSGSVVQVNSVADQIEKRSLSKEITNAHNKFVGELEILEKEIDFETPNFVTQQDVLENQKYNAHKAKFNEPNEISFIEKAKRNTTKEPVLSDFNKKFEEIANYMPSDDFETKVRQSVADLKDEFLDIDPSKLDTKERKMVLETIEAAEFKIKVLDKKPQPKPTFNNNNNNNNNSNYKPIDFIKYDADAGSGE